MPTAKEREKPGQPPHTGMLLVISGPAGVGKDTVWTHAATSLPTFQKATTCTTRPRRPHETEGVSYHFLSEEEFDRLIHQDELLEWAFVHGYRYGVPQKAVLGRLNEGQDVVCVIDVQGAQRIRHLFPWAILVFISPPPGREKEILAERILGRSQVDQAELERRLATAVREMTFLPLYDYHIINEDVDHAARQLCDIVVSERARHSS